MPDLPAGRASSPAPGLGKIGSQESMRQPLYASSFSGSGSDLEAMEQFDFIGASQSPQRASWPLSSQQQQQQQPPAEPGLFADSRRSKFGSMGYSTLWSRSSMATSTVSSLPELAAATGIHWTFAALIFLGFALPSAITGLGYAIGNAGYVLGVGSAVVLTCGSCGGSYMLLRVVLSYPQCRTMGDVGGAVLCGPGRLWGDVIQFSNFVLFLPVAMQLCADALQGAIDPSFSVCDEYFKLIVAGLCLLSTQCRSLANASVLAMLSLACTLGFVLVLLVLVATNEPTPPLAQQRAALAFGNTVPDLGQAMVQGALGISVASWAYVPSFLTAELAGVMAKPAELTKSLVLSAALNVALFVLVGVSNVALWGPELPNPITISPSWAALSSGKGWSIGSQQMWARLFNLLLFVANLVSYGLDSIPLVNACLRGQHGPEAEADRSSRGWWRFLLASLPTWFFGLTASVFVPSLFDMLAFVTALTTPWATQVFPAVVFYYHLRQLEEQGVAIKRSEWLLAGVVLAIGVANFVLCMFGAVGQVVIPELRGEAVVGCKGWMLIDQTK